MPGRSLSQPKGRAPADFHLDARSLAIATLIARLTGLAVALVGLVGLLGWILDIEYFRALVVGGIAIKANAAICLLLSGVALLILSGDRRPSPRYHIVGYVFGLIVSIVGGMTLFQHISGHDLGIDTLLFDEAESALATLSPGRMGPPASASFLLAGIALALLDWRTRAGRVPSQVLALLVGLVVALPLIGHGYATDPLYGVSPVLDGIARFTGIAVHTALAIAALAAGIFAARPRSGITSVICADDAGGILARRMIIPAILIPFLLGWARTFGEQQGWLTDEIGRPMLVLALIVSFTTLVWFSARSMSRLGREREAALAEKQATLLRVAADQDAMAQERRRLIDELRERADELALANAAKDRFLAVLSHELRTPLTPVLLTLSLMETSKDLTPALREDLGSIRRNVELESQLISDLLDLTRIARGKLQIERREVDIHQVLQSAIDICQREASAHLITDFTASRSIVQGDQTRLQQVFWNLIGNAQKFTPPQGAIFVRTADTADGRVRIEVKDTGTGIDPETLPKLFNAFEQGGVRAERQQAGLGLGLSISKAVVEAHGGRIGVTSEGRGKGSKFVIELPATERPAASAARPAAPAAPADRVRSLSVLLVEDHEPTMRAMSRLLSYMGHRVTTATSAASAIAAAGQDGLDLLVCDLGLPDGSGLDVMRRVRNRFQGRAIALTGYGMESDVQASREAGFTEHLTKPVDSLALENALRRVAGPAAPPRRA
jgi:signal transduction histidine kinase/CheY-like chemotaxis protein